MIKKVVQAGDSRLRKLSKPVEKIDRKILLLISDLKETLLAHKDPEGVGLAAPQIGKNLRVFVMRDGEEIKTVINPEIISTTKAKTAKTKKDNKDEALEGCLSIPHYYGSLTRGGEITIKYLNEDGQKVVETFKDFPAQIVQHEIDHLEGHLFVDRLLKQKRPLYQIKGDEVEEVDFTQ
ncbi:peptide deformylase [Patescibacteria group bacterium]|nr:peptide deformylase [Patescibacteria group bacterium]MBU0777181.1 peptide deformylase [Patescibacteria group bacterium]MBU0845876.1 peptide deformylase [Patescibacteria group bacterium]MBU0922903.1 peptide deformylase [Patescibacteria group bacterium]MBU1066364.1 peptide deformylase [Patescibacteria group bacterium]